MKGSPRVNRAIVIFALTLTLLPTAAFASSGASFFKSFVCGFEMLFGMSCESTSVDGRAQSAAAVQAIASATFPGGATASIGTIGTNATSTGTSTGSVSDGSNSTQNGLTERQVQSMID